MANKDRFAKLKVYKYTPGGMALSFILLFAGIGTYVITQSKADTISSTNFYSSTSVSPSAGVFPTNDSINKVGSQNVTQVSSGSKLIYTAANKQKFKTICYYVRVAGDLSGGTTAKVEFVGQGNSKTVNLQASQDYQSICVKSGHKSQKPYNIYNEPVVNGPDLFVYQAITSS